MRVSDVVFFFVVGALSICAVEYFHRDLISTWIMIASFMFGFFKGVAVVSSDKEELRNYYEDKIRRMESRNE